MVQSITRIRTGEPRTTMTTTFLTPRDEAVLYMSVQPPEVDPSIPVACALLDEVLTSPRWDELIDPKTLDLYAPSHCVLGQTGTWRYHDGKIPGDGVVPWATFGEGDDYLEHWLDAHPTAATALGANYALVTEVFGACVDDLDDGTDQNDQWRRWLSYRQAMRAQATQEAA